MDPYSYSVAALNGFGLSGGRRIFLNEAARQAYIRRLKTRYLKTTRKGKTKAGKSAAASLLASYPYSNKPRRKSDNAGGAAKRHYERRVARIPDELRSALKKRGVNLEYFVSKLSAMNRHIRDWAKKDVVNNSIELIHNRGLKKTPGAASTGLSKWAYDEYLVDHPKKQNPSPEAPKKKRVRRSATDRLNEEARSFYGRNL